MVAGPLFGRDAEVARVLAELTAGGRCTVLGTGGVGKSAVARAAADAVRASRSVVWVDAEPAVDAASVLGELLRSLGCEQLPGESPETATRAALEGCSALVVLDGIEQVAGDLAAAIARWPTSPSGPWLLMTSRRPVPTAARPLVRLAPLSTSDDDTRCPAAQMLIDEVWARGGDVPALLADAGSFDSVLRASGGIPMAIQLIADSVVRFGIHLTAEHPVAPEEIVGGCLQRTVELLDEDDRRVFRCLGLTAGPFTLEMIAAVGGFTGEAAQQVAGHLVDHGLLHLDGARFDMLPPIRAGARFLLETSGGADRTLDALLSWIVEAAAADDRQRARAVSDNLDTCISVAWHAVRDSRRRIVADDVLEALFDPMYEGLRHRELLALLAARLADDAGEPRRWAIAARRAAICAAECDTIASAQHWLDRANAVARTLADEPLTSLLWSTDAWLRLDIGDHAGATRSADRSMAAAGGDRRLLLPTLRCLAELRLAAGDLDAAEQTARTVLEDAGGTTSVDALLARTTLGWCLVERGRRAEAVAHARRLADDLLREQSQPSEMTAECDLIAVAADPEFPCAATTVDNPRLPWWMRLQQRIRLAARLPIAQHWEQVMHTAADVVVLADLIPLGHPRIGGTLLLGDAALAGGDLRQAARAYEQALRDAARSPYALRGADAFDGFAVLAARRGDAALAGRAAATAAQVRERAGASAWPRPSLPDRVAPRGSAPSSWLRDGLPTSAAVDELVRPLTVRASDPLGTLTHAERGIATLVRKGMSNNEIAAHLVISRRTVESHLARVFQKLDLRSRTQLAALPVPYDLDA